MHSPEHILTTDAAEGCKIVFLLQHWHVPAYADIYSQERITFTTDMAEGSKLQQMCTVLTDRGSGKIILCSPL